MSARHMSDAPYTAQDIHRFNALTHFPKKLETENERFVSWREGLRTQTLATLAKWGQSSMPHDVAAAFDSLVYAQWNYYHESLRARELAPPWTVTGPANYSKVHTPRKQEQAQRCHERGWEAIDKAKERLRRAIGRYSPNAAISSDDPDAIDKIYARIESLEEDQERMKEANKIVRDKKIPDEEKVYILANDLRLGEKNARKLLEPDYMGRLGFPDYALKNNNANIRRLRARIEQLEKAAATPTTEEEHEGARIVDNTEDNRLQIFFDDKPSPEIRQRLKSHGFRWAPSVGAWQRHRSSLAKYHAEQIVASLTRDNVTA